MSKWSIEMCRSVLLLWVLLTCTAVQALANVVTVGEQFHFLTVWPEADRSTTPMTYLHPGSQADLLEDQGDWLHIQLGDGREGYALARYAAVSAGEPHPSAELRLHFIDVGQGDSTLIECPNGNTILVDAGTHTSGVRGEDVKAYLTSVLGAGFDIDDLVITHPDSDHYNLLPDTLRNVQVGHVWYVGRQSSYKYAFRQWLRNIPPARRTKLNKTYFDPMDQPNSGLDCGNVDVHVLAASVGYKTNAKSIVLMLRYNDFTAILTGDATHKTERKIESRYPDDWLDVDVLKLGHHGSRATSTDDTWTEHTEPETAVASALDRYGHPAKDVIDRIKEYTTLRHSHTLRMGDGSPGNYTYWNEETREAVFATASSGNIVIRTTGAGHWVDENQ